MTTNKLPPGQRAIPAFPRFGLLEFASRFPDMAAAPGIKISGDVGRPVSIGFVASHEKINAASRCKIGAIGMAHSIVLERESPADFVDELARLGVAVVLA